MLDTDTLIYFIRNKPVSVSERMNALQASDSICMSFVTWAELLKGAEGSLRKAEVLRRLSVLSQHVPVSCPAGPDLCSHYALHATRLKAQGRPIGGNDLWIASHALSEGATLVTSNVGEFGRIEGLKMEDWAREP